MQNTLTNIIFSIYNRNMNLFSISSLLPTDAKESIGVDIGYEDIRLVQMIRSSGKPLLSKYVRLQFPEGASKNSSEFSDFLKSALTDFCSSSNKKEIWTAVSMSRASGRYLKIPKVSDNQISNAAFWTFKREETAFKESEHVFTFGIIENTGQNISDQIEIMACTAPKYDIERLKQLFNDIGFPLTGISLYPLAVENLFRSGWITPEEGSMATLWIGRSRSRIDIFFPGGALALSRNIKTSERSMIESVREKIGRENHEFRDIAQQFFNSMILRKLPLAIEGAEPFGEQQIFRMIQPALDRLIRQLERTFDHYNVNICNVPIEKIYVSGDIAGYSPIVEYLAQRCGEDIHTAEMDPFAPIQSGGQEPCPESAQEKLSFVPAVGLSLSDTATTPNFVVTYQDREKLGKIFRIRHAVIAVFIILSLLCGGLYVWQKKHISRKDREISALKQELQRVMLPANPEIVHKLTSMQIPFKPENDLLMLTREMIKLLDVRINAEKQKLRLCAARYAEIVAISDILRFTPNNIQLTSIGVSVHKSDPQKPETLPVSIEGIIKGRHDEFEVILNNYINELRKSPILTRTSLVNKQADIFEEEAVLRFKIQSEVSRN